MLKQKPFYHQELFTTSIIIVLLFVLDRVTKAFFINGSHNKDFGFFAFSYVQNTGASFGILKNMNIPLIIISIIVFALLIYYYKQIPRVSFMLIMAGLLGNLFDRIAFGFVVDFIDFKFFPVFNIADSCISIGIIVWILLMVFERKK